MISINVDPRIELLTAVQLFTSWSEHGIWRESYPYKEDMVKFFENYRDHQAIKLCENLLQKGFSYDAPVGFMMHLSNPPELKIVKSFSEKLIERAGDAPTLHELVEALHDFSLKSNFFDFWKEHLSFYRTIEEKTSSEVRLNPTINSLEDYFGVKQHGYYLILAPLFLGYYGYRIKVNDSFDVYAVLGLREIREGIPVFGAASFHEFAHSFVNPLTEKFRSQFRGRGILYEPVKSKMIEMGYGEWETMVNEHIIRAIDLRVNRKESAKDILDREEGRGFIYIKPLFNLLEKYEQQRDKYQTFTDFYPNIVELSNSIGDVIYALESLKHTTSPFKGPINEVFGYKDYLDKILIIEPTETADDVLRKKTKEYLDSIQTFLRNRFCIEAPKVTDVEALKMDLKENVPVVYGTPNSNALLKKTAREFPFVISKEGIKLGEDFYAGEDLRFITVYLNPMNKKLPILIYTATRDEGILGINSLFHGPTDYVLYKGKDKIVEGHYKKDKMWSFVE